MKKTVAVADEVTTINCPVGGHPIVAVYWERDGLRLPYNHRQKSFANGTLVIADIQRSSDEGNYKCIAIGKDESLASNTVQVQVLVRPAVEQFVFPRSLQEGQRYNVLCSVTKGDAPVQIKWLKDGRALALSSNMNNNNHHDNGEFAGIDIIHVTQFSSTLIFESLRPEHSGNYTCEASNGAGSATANSSMIINVPPKWRIEPIDSSVVKGRTAIIDCQAEGFPSPNIRWSKADGFLRMQPPAEFKPINSSPHLRVFQNGSLAVHNVQKSDSAFYLCQANNGIGSGLSKVIKLTVNLAPNFGSKFRAENVRKGHEAKLDCDCQGDKPMSVTWTKDKMPFDPKADPRYQLIEAITSEGITSQLIVRSVDRRDSALFTCMASNRYGEDDTNVQLVVQEPADPPQVTVESFDGRSAKIAWSTPYSGNSPISHYVVQHKLQEDKWDSRIEEHKETVSGSVTALHLRNLTPITEYQLRVFAINDIGKSEPSETVTFKTDEEAPGGPPLHVKAMALSSKSLRITWQPPTRNLHYGQIRGYYVGYKVFGSESEAFVYKTLDVNGSDRSSSSAGSSTSAVETALSGLKKFTKYSVIVQALNSKGTGPVSDEIVAQTLQNDPPESPVLKVTSTSSNSIVLTWTDNGDETVSPITSYRLYQKKSPVAEWSEYRLSGQQTSHQFDYLACGTKYQFYIVAYNAIGKSDPSESVAAKTEGMVPVAPHKNSLLHIETSSATIHLDTWHDGSCPIVSFKIMYKQHIARKWVTLGDQLYTPDQKQVLVSDLLPGTLYDLKITAINEAGPTEALYSFYTVSLIKAPATVYGNEASSSSPSSSLALDLDLLLPTSISLVIVLLVILLASVCHLRKRRLANNMSFLDSTGGGLYDISKPESGPEAIGLSEMDSLKQLKKLNCENVASANNGGHVVLGAASNNGGPGIVHVTSGSVLDGAYYPSPYAASQVNGDDEGQSSVHVLHHHQTSMKKMCHDDREPEPLYATVKRTPRAPRSDVHIYQCPVSIMSTASQQSATCVTDSGFNSSDWQVTGNGMVGSSMSTAFVRLHEDPESITLSGAQPCIMSMYGIQMVQQ
ncbi:Down syndrome cell adhesion molecule -like protein [Halotydeus destructor]|nr:Down syndrome cell adhesion molecule -like protein [Halotydeus destructor]